MTNPPDGCHADRRKHKKKESIRGRSQREIKKAVDEYAKTPRQST
jgi:hypothetical protein